MEKNVLSDEYLDYIAQRAILNGFIPLLYDLAYIMAVEEDYRDILPKLWEFYECNVRHGTEIKTVTREDRAGVWFILLQRWGGTPPDQSNSFLPPPYWGKVRPIRYLNLYDPVTRELKTPGQKRDENNLVKLEDLKEYLRSIEQTLEINFQLPKRLFPSIAEDTGSDKDLSAPNLEYVFVKTGPTWKIVFEGREMAGLEGSGFEYLHYLIENYRHPKEIEVDELFKAIEKNIPTDRTMEDPDLHESFQEDESWQEVTDKRTLKDVRENIEDLEDQKKDAERNNDQYRVSHLTEEIEKLNEYCTGSQFQGRLKAFSDHKKRIADRIRKALTRALQEIQKHDEKAHDHLRRAFPPLYSPQKSYKPSEDVPSWKLE
jgi:hypothetical protein